MITYKSFILLLTILLLIFLGFNGIIWFFWVRDLVSPSANSGDLVRMGYISGIKLSHKKTFDLPNHHIDIREYDKTPVDMITIGDSFSVGEGKGHNSHYQDYIASINNLRVLNIPSYVHKGKEFQFQPILTLSKIINSGYLDIMKPKYLLLESIERLAIPRLTSEFTLNITSSIDDIDNYYKNNSFDKPQNSNTELHFINNGNWKFISNSVQYHFKDTARNSAIFMTKLSKPLFSSALSDSLLFYIDDIKAANQGTKHNIEILNQNLNTISAILQKKGITLVFMPIVDKLNLYHPYLISRKYPESSFFEELRKVDKNYIFIDTKEILSHSLNKGELDIFHQDDSHWTWKASKAIFEKIRFDKLR